MARNDKGGIEMSTVRNATMEDAARILEIYDYYVRETAITFEYTTPSLEEFQGRMRHTMEKYPYLVIEENGKIEGYAYAEVFKGRAAYDRSCEMTVYLAHDAQKNGLGRKIYEAMEEALRKMGMLNLYACIGVPEVDDEYLTSNSMDFHAHLGYELCGTFHNCGYKFGRWYHMVWMEKMVGEHTANPAPLVPYPQL